MYLLVYLSSIYLQLSRKQHLLHTNVIKTDLFYYWKETQFVDTVNVKFFGFFFEVKTSIEMIKAFVKNDRFVQINYCLFIRK